MVERTAEKMINEEVVGRFDDYDRRRCRRRVEEEEKRTEKRRILEIRALSRRCRSSFSTFSSAIFVFQ